MKRVLTLHDKEQTKALGRLLAPHFLPGDVVVLSGDLGAGKTTLTSGIGQGLNVESDVISPTFNILRCYFKGRLPLYHIDAYRLEGQNIEIGLDEAIEGDGLCVIEWPQFIEPLLPDDPLSIEIRNRGENEREFVFTCPSSRFDWIEELPLEDIK